MEFSIKHSILALALTAAASTAAAVPSNQLITWNTDAVADNALSGTLGDIDVTVTQTLFDNVNYETRYGGGTTANLDWGSVASFADIAPDWNTSASQQAGILEWASGDSLFVEVTFSQEVTNPVLFFTGLGARSARGQDFGFDFAAVLNLIASDESDGVVINQRNNHLVTLDGSHRGSYDNGIAVELEGTFDSLFFLANSQRDVADSALFTIGSSVDAGTTEAFSTTSFSTVSSFAFASTPRTGTALSASSVPEPAPFAMFLAGALALVVARRRAA